MSILVLSLFAGLNAFAETYPTQSVTNGFCVPVVHKKNCVRGMDKVEISVIDEDKALDMFRSFRNDPEMGYGYRIDGCYARASRMAKAAEKQGITFGKVFAEGRLQVLSRPPERPGAINWEFHVAPVVFVKKTDGSTELRVFDPVLFEKPIPVSQWKGRLVEELKPAQVSNDMAENFYKKTLETSLHKDTFKKPYMIKQKNYGPKVTDLYYGSKYQMWERSRAEESLSSWSNEDEEYAEGRLKDYYTFSENTALFSKLAQPHLPPNPPPNKIPELPAVEAQQPAKGEQ